MKSVQIHSWSKNWRTWSNTHGLTCPATVLSPGKGHGEILPWSRTSRVMGNRRTLRQGRKFRMHWFSIGKTGKQTPCMVCVCVWCVRVCVCVYAQLCLTVCDPMDCHLGLCPGPNFPLQVRQELGVAFQTHTGSQASSRGEAKDSSLPSSPDRYLLEPTERPKESQASCGVWREDSVLLSMPGRKQVPHLVMTVILAATQVSSIMFPFNKVWGMDG